MRTALLVLEAVGEHQPVAAGASSGTPVEAHDGLLVVVDRIDSAEPVRTWVPPRAGGAGWARWPTHWGPR